MTSGNNVEVIFKVAFSLLMISLMEKACGGAISTTESSAITFPRTTTISSLARSGETNTGTSPITTTEAPTTARPKSTKESPTTTWSKPANQSPTTTTPSTTGHYSIGSLTRKPTNTAVVTGSTNIPLECASSYGTDAIIWSFTMLGSFNNETILISNGYQLLNTNQQMYELYATVNSSELIIRQLSNLTEGTYSCYDGVESTSALLLMIPSPISMEPLFGPVAGGTHITITGSSAIIIDYLSRNVASYTPNIRGVRNVYFGNDLYATSVSLLPSASSTYELVAATPSTTKASIGQPLLVIIEFSPTPFNMTFNKEFIYLPNPEIAGVYPNSFIVTGGTLLDVFGQGLSSVAKPIIQLTVVITRSADNSSIPIASTTSTSRVCTVPQGNDTYMQCPMPPLNIPEDFLEMFNLQYNASAIRRKRDKKPSKANVLTVVEPNGVDRADICLGFILDGYKEYENINDVLPDTAFIFYSAPEINSSSEVIEFDPSEDELIYVKGRYMLRGCRLRDYVVHIGNQICTNSNLQDNQLSCRPPKEKPSSTKNDTIHCDQHLSITITLGYKQYQYACLMYIDNSKTFALIVGLTVGLVGFALFLIILIACIVIYRRKQISQEIDRHQNYGRQEIRNPHYDDDVEPESQQDYNARIYTRQNTISLYTPNDEYLTSIDEFDSNS